jgi:hypothetical protein
MIRLRLAGTCVLVVGIFAFTGSALADNGHGNDNGGATSAAPGNSGNAPGQVKKDTPAPAAAPTVQSATTTTTTTTTSADPSAGPTVGVKPANDTAHDTHAPAASTSTKQYGNGQTAGAIAIKHGASPPTPLHGPGNSQPHKAAPCGGRHEVDVHALKAHHAGECGGTPTPHPTPSPSPTPPAHGPANSPTPDSKPASDPADPGRHGSARPVQQTVAHGHRGSGSSGVLSATQRTAELPFTGQSLWLAVLAGLVMLGAGLALRQIRTAEAGVQSGRDHPDRARHPARGARIAVRSRSGR